MPLKINVEKRAKSLASRQRDKGMKQVLLDYYGSFEEAVLCGVRPLGRDGYIVPMKQGASWMFGHWYDRPDQPMTGYTLEDLQGQIAIGMPDLRHRFKPHK